DALKEQRHDGDEDDQSPHPVSEHRVDPVTEGGGDAIVPRQDSLFNFGDAGVAGFDDGAAPIDAGGLEWLSGLADALADLLGIMGAAGNLESLVGQKNKRL